MELTDNGIKLLDIVVKGSLGSVIAAGVAYYGNSLQQAREKQLDETRQLQSSIEISSHQKELDVDLGMRLFGTLMSYYFEQDRSPARPEAAHQQMLLLRLVALNFEDVPIHLKPLYQDLNGRLSAEDKQKLRSYAQEVARRQAFRMTVKDAYDSGPREVKQGDSLSIPELLMTVTIGSVGGDGVLATIASKVGDRSVGPFTVSYFDAPLVDNIMLGEYRVSLVLLNLNDQAERAQVRVIAFPKHLAADRFDIKEMSRGFQNKDRP